MDLGGLGGAVAAAVTLLTAGWLIGLFASVRLDAGAEAGDRGRQNCLPRNRYTSSSLNWMPDLLLPEGLGVDVVFGCCCCQHWRGRGTGVLLHKLVVIFSSWEFKKTKKQTEIPPNFPFFKNSGNIVWLAANGLTTKAKRSLV
jgi:hypothetical protein